MNYKEARALEKLIHDLYGDVLEIIGLVRSGTNAHAVACIDRATGDYTPIFHENDLFSDYGDRTTRP